MPSTTIVMPTYNEANNLPAMVDALMQLDVADLHILIIDDASPDGTGEVADAFVEKHPGRVHVIHRQGKLGLGTAYLEGFAWALARGADYIVQMDADFSHSPSYIPQLLAHAKEYDVVIGSRYVSGGQLDKRWGWARRFLSWWANYVWVRLILDLNVRDATAGFKCWRRNALERIDLGAIRSNGYVFQVEMCYVAEKCGLHIKEIPIYFEDRRIGQSKMSMSIKLEAALRLFEIRLRHRNGRAVVPSNQLQ